MKKTMCSTNYPFVFSQIMLQGTKCSTNYYIFIIICTAHSFLHLLSFNGGTQAKGNGENGEGKRGKKEKWEGE